MKQYDSDFDVLEEHIDFKGKNVIDVGCGDGGKAKQLVNLGANVIGIEPNLESWKISELESPGFRILNGGAENLDIEDNWADVVIFMYSLHHVPESLMDTALSEANRVLKPSGTLYIAEPIARGNYQDVCEPFLDETLIREQAIQAINNIGRLQFDQCKEFEYQVSDNFDNYAAFVDEMMRYSLNRYEINDVDNQQVKQIFEQTRHGNHYQLDQPVKCWMFSHSNPS